MFEAFTTAILLFVARNRFLVDIYFKIFIIIALIWSSLHESGPFFSYTPALLALFTYEI